MCWHLSVTIPRQSVELLHRELPKISPAHPETDAEIISVIPKDTACFSLGVQCACDLFRKEASAVQQLRKRANRNQWSQAKLQRALKNMDDDWYGLHPEVREAIAVVAKSAGQVTLFLFRSGDSRKQLYDKREVDIDTFRLDASVVTENRLLIVKSSLKTEIHI